MIDENLNEQIHEEVPAIEETKVLLGLMNKPQADHWLVRDYSVRNRWGPQLSESNKEDIIEDCREEFDEIYQDATSGLEAVPPFRDANIELADLPDSEDVQDHKEGFENSEYFTEVFNNIPPGRWQIKLVPLDCLVAYQSHVTTRAHTDIPTSDDGYLDVLQYCLPIDVKNLLHVQSDGISDKAASVRVVSRNPNVNFIGPNVEEIEDRPPGNINISFQIKARPNFIQVEKFRDRYILTNGYHRCYQLMQAGEDYVPAVVRYVEDYSDTGAAGVGWFPDARILGDRPPLVRDFLTGAAVDLETKSRNKMIRATIEKLDVEV